VTILVQTEKEFEAALKILSESEYCVIDTETDEFYGPLVGIGTLCDIKGVKNHLIGHYFPFGHTHNYSIGPGPDSRNLPQDWINGLLEVASGLTRIYHNRIYDEIILEREGTTFDKGRSFCTVVMMWLANENEFSYELDDLMTKYTSIKKFKKQLKEIAKISGGWPKVPPEAMALYCIRDCEGAWELFNVAKAELKEQGIEDFLEREMEFNTLLKEMIQRGILIDQDIARRLSAESKTQMQAFQDKAGYDPMKRAQLARRLFVKPPVGLGLPLPPGQPSQFRSPEFPQGIPYMNREILTRYSHPEIEEILDYRSWVKAGGTWYDGWLDKLWSDGRIHASFKQHGTKTSRLSCEKPNMHQIPRDIEKTPVKKMLKSPEGYELWSFDMNQVEFRLAVVYCKIKALIKLIEAGEDVHKSTAELTGAYELYPDNPTFARYCGKQTNYATIYLGGVDAVWKQLWRIGRIDVPRDFIENMLYTFHRKYPGFRRTAGEAEQVAKQNGYIKYWNGWKRRFPYRGDAHKAFNSAIQGGAAQIIRESQFRLRDFQQVNQVHDDLWIYLPISEGIEKQVKEVKKEMEWATEYFQFPFPIDAKRLA